MSPQEKLLTTRLQSIDFLRGLVIAIMTVDHAREYFFFAVPLADPMDLAQVDGATFFARLLAHFCAPIFIFLTGLSACLHAQRRHLSRTELSRFLLKRGALLAVLEVTLINFAWTFSFPPHKLFLQVIWAIGLSMMSLAALIWLPRKALLAVALVILGGHNMLDGVHFAEGTAAYYVWGVLHQRSVLPIGDMLARTSYPVLPWIGVIALGFFCGRWFDGSMNADARQALLRRTGLLMVVVFVWLRLANGYGEPNHWQVFEGDPAMTLMAFFNLTKYPPSLLFIVMALGPALLLLRAAENWRGKWVDVLVVFGRVPFFYYVAHLYALHLAYRLSGVAMGYRWDGTPVDAQLPAKLDVGSIGWVWVIALITLAVLYPLMRKLAQLKAQKRSALLSYF